MISFTGLLVGFVALGSQVQIGPRLANPTAAGSSSELQPVIIALKGQSDGKLLLNAGETMGRRERRQYVVNELKALSSRTQPGLLAELRRAATSGEASDIEPLWIADAVSCRLSREEIKRLAGRGDLWFIESSRICAPDASRQEVRGRPRREGRLPVGIEWHISRIGADTVWRALGVRGDSVVVGLIDSGVNYDHVDLASHLWTDSLYPHHGWDIVDNDDDPRDTDGHGTVSAGLVSGDGTAGDSCGVAPRAQIMACRVTYPADILRENEMFAAIQFCLAPPLAPNHGADLVLIPFGWPHSFLPSRALWRQTLDNLAAAGVLVVASSGSDQGNPPDGIWTPADCPGPWHNPANQPGGVSDAVTAGATNQYDGVMYFSSHGPVTWQDVAPFNDYPYNPGSGLIKPDVCAPGISITSLSYGNDSGYDGNWLGNGLSASITAGVVALMLSAKPELTPRRIDSILEVTAKLPEGYMKNNDSGSGRVRAYAAVQGALRSGIGDNAGTVSTPGVALGFTGANPSSGAIDIWYSNSRPEAVELTLLDLAGRRIAEIGQGRPTPGRHALHWDVTDAGRKSVAPGVYFCRLRTASGCATAKVVLR